MVLLDLQAEQAEAGVIRHTPGPWAFRKFGTWVLVADHGPRGVILGATLDRGMPHLVQRDPDGVLCELDPNHPDCRLIAAAPELLSALKDLFQMMDEEILVRNTEHDHKPEWAGLAIGTVTRLKFAYDAIAKAEGR